MNPWETRAGFGGGIIEDARGSGESVRLGVVLFSAGGSCSGALHGSQIGSEVSWGVLNSVWVAILAYRGPLELMWAIELCPVSRLRLSNSINLS